MRNEIVFLLIALLALPLHAISADKVRDKALTIEIGTPVEVKVQKAKYKGQLALIESDGIILKVPSTSGGVDTLKLQYQEIQSLRERGDGGRRAWATFGKVAAVYFLLMIPLAIAIGG